MKKSIIIVTALLVSLSASAAPSFKITCDSPTDEHPALDIEINANTLSAQIIIEENSGKKSVFLAGLKEKSAAELKNTLLSQPIILVGRTSDSFIGGNSDFYSDAMTVFLAQKTPGLPGAQTAVVTLNNKVTIHTCTLE